MRCSIAPSSSAICTCARSAATTCASARASGSCGFLDPGAIVEIGAGIEPEDPLKFRDSKRYKDRLAQAQKATGEKDALVVLAGTLHGQPVVACAFEFQFLGGSMGSVVGERFKRGVDYCIAATRPFVCFTASGGARMQEALYSLLQMAKTTAALSRLAQAHLPYISVLTDPTTGGVSASLAMLGDLNIAEPRALIGFAGPRVIQQTMRETLPEGFQRSEFLLEHGAIDMIVDRRDMRDRIAALLRLLLKLPAQRGAGAGPWRARLARRVARAAGVGARAGHRPGARARGAGRPRRWGCRAPHCRVITVGGTNGKGSTVAHLEALLRPCGARVGPFTSPHLLRYNERIHIGGAEAADADAGRGVRAHRGGARRTITLTFFEYNTLAALLRVRRPARSTSRCSRSAWAAGSMPPTSSTPTSRCCARWASIIATGSGDTLEAIGAEKAGIFRAGRPAVLGTPQMPDSVYAAIAQLGRPRGRSPSATSPGTCGAPSWDYHGLACGLDRPARAARSPGHPVPQRRHGARGPGGARGDPAEPALRCATLGRAGLARRAGAACSFPGASR